VIFEHIEKAGEILLGLFITAIGFFLCPLCRAKHLHDPWFDFDIVKTYK